MRRRGLTLKHYVPLAGFVVPTVVIGYGFVIPESCIRGVNELTVGFGISIAGAAVTYWSGLRMLLREVASSTGPDAASPRGHPQP